MAATTPVSAVSESRVRELFEAFNSHNVQRMAESFADDIVFMDSVQPEAPVKGKQAFRQQMEAWFKAFPDMSYTTTTIVVNGDTACALYLATGTFKAPLTLPDATIEPTRRRGGYTGCVVMQFNAQGKLRAITDVYDAAAWAAQYDVTPPS